MSKFDLEAAKRGEAVQVQQNGGWVDMHFIGLDSRGLCVFEDAAGDITYRHAVRDALRMKPKQVEMWTYPTRTQGMLSYKLTVPFASKRSAETCKSDDYDACGEVQMIIVEE